MKTALITGASGGIGMELSILFAKNGHNIILVARNIDKLEKLADELQGKFKITALPLKYDLSIQGSSQKLFDEIKERKIDVDFLVNNAGFGDFGALSVDKLDKYTNMLNLNVVALTELTTLFANDMKERKFGKIMNVASTASFQPLPYFSVYAATKAYVLSFSEALHFEFKKFGVTISTLCPGATKTNFAAVAGVENSPMFENDKGMTAQKVAEISYKEMMKNKMTIVTGFGNKLSAYFSGKMPARKIVPFAVGKSLKKFVK